MLSTSAGGLACIGTITGDDPDLEVSPTTPGSVDAGAVQLDAAPEEPEEEDPPQPPAPIEGEPIQACLDIINSYRASLGLPAYQRWNAAETCAVQQAQMDSQTQTPHGAFGQCNEFAQNECFGYGTAIEAITQCLASMWAEGPGPPGPEHGHYLTMSSTQYSKVACGFYQMPDGGWWMVQDFK